MPSPEQKRKIKSQYEILSIPYHVVKTDCSRGARHGQSQWQYDHCTAKDTKRNSQKKNHDSILLKWQNMKRCRKSRTAVGWTEESCRYLDSIASVDISKIATWSERSRYEHNFTLGVNDGAKPGPTKHRPDFPRAVRTLAAINQEEEKTNPYIPKHLRERQRPIEERVRLERRWNSWGCDVSNNWSQASSSSATYWWQPQEWQESQERPEWQGWREWQ